MKGFHCKENTKAVAAGQDATIYVGTYTDESVLAHDPKGEPSDAGIHSFRLDSRTGRLTPLSTCDVGPNPAFLIKHPSLPIMWASTECIKTDGEVVTLAMEPEGKLKQIATQGSGGKSTCYVNLMDGAKHMMVVSYWDAKVAMLPINRDGTISEPVQVTVQPGAEYVDTNQPDRKEHWAYRQRWPHTHCSVTEPYSRKLHFVTDLGTDSVCIYQHNPGSGHMALAGTVKLRAQHGPRHIIFHPTLRVAYIVNELISSVTVLAVGDIERLAEGGAGADGMAPPVEESTADDASLLTEAMTISTLPEGVENSGTWHEGGVWKAHSHCSEIRIDPEGRFVYVGNRGHDSICVYAVDQTTGMLKQTAVQPSGGEFPRNFNFSPCGRFMIVGNQRSNNLTVFERDPTHGTLSMMSQTDVPSPNYVYACASV